MELYYSCYIGRCTISIMADKGHIYIFPQDQEIISMIYIGQTNVCLEIISMIYIGQTHLYAVMGNQNMIYIMYSK